MDYLYILLPGIVWVISQSIKFLVRIIKKDVPLKLRGLFWTYIWAGGAPSTHTAILTSSLILVWNDFHFSSVFTFCLALTCLWLFDLVNRHKKQEVMNSYFKNDDDLKKSVREGFLLDLAGHTVGEIIWGAVLGITLGLIAVHMIG